MARKCKYTFQPDCEGLEGRQLQSTTIQNVNSGLVLDDPAFSKSNGTAIIQYQSNGGANQHWNVVLLRSGHYMIQNAYSGLVLDDPAFSKSNGTAIIQYGWSGGLNQQWNLIRLDGSPITSSDAFEIQNVASGKVLDDPAFSTSNGTAIIQYDWNGGANQRWIIPGLA